MLCELKPLQIESLETVRNWRNHEKVNRFMFKQHVISKQEHQDWFKSCEKNPLRHLMLYYENQLAVGFLQLEQMHSDSDVFEWGFYVSPEAAKGTGSRMLENSLSYAFETLGALKVYAEVLEFNQPSIHLHGKMGFVEEGVLRKHAFLLEDYFDVHCFGLLKAEWQ